MEISTTNRGFGLIEFVDQYGEVCSLQESSLSTDKCIWLGVSKTTAHVQYHDHRAANHPPGWVQIDLHKELNIKEGFLHIPTRMHLNQEQVKALLPHLTKFAETGEVF